MVILQKQIPYDKNLRTLDFAYTIKKTDRHTAILNFVFGIYENKRTIV